MKEYRTAAQFLEIDDNVYNGNWKDAAIQCYEYGFYAKDLCQFKEAIDNEEISGYCNMSYADIAELAEMACKYRFTK